MNWAGWHAGASGAFKAEAGGLARDHWRACGGDGGEVADLRRTVGEVFERALKGMPGEG